MSTYTDVFGNDTVPPSGLGYASFTITTNTTFVWPYNTDGSQYPVAKVMDVACAAGNAITLPDATEVSTGEDFLIRNVGSNALIVKDAVGVQIALVAVGAASYFYLTDNTTAAGVYGVIGFGIGTSTVDAASLVGYGIKAIGASLNQSHPVFPTNTPITIDANHRAKLVVFTGGAGTFNLTSAATLGDDYFTLFRNEGTGTATLDPASGELIDGLSTLQIQPNESLMLICTGTQWYTVGYGRSVLYQFTQLTKDVSSGGTITLTAAEAANKLLTFIGNPSGAVNVVVPSIVAVYYTQSAVSTAQTITLKTAAGSGVPITQGARIIALCDGTNVVSAQSAVANTSVSLTDGSAAVPSLYFATSTNTGLYKSGTQDLGVTVNGSAVGVFGSTGLQGSTIGANSTQRHTVPAVSSDTVALLAATQTLTNKTLTDPVISTISNTGTLTLPTSTDTLVGRATTDTLTNKTISVDNNTVSGIAASSFVLSNASGNIDGAALQKAIPAGVVVGTTDSQTLTNKTIALGSNTVSGTLAQFNTALTDGDFASLEGSETLTNKTISVDANTVSGIAASSFVLSNASGNIDGTAAQKVIPTGAVVGTTDTQTLTNKTISGASNTLSNIGNASLTNSSITINGNAVSLGGSTTVTATATNALTIGTGLSGTSYNGSAPVTIAIDSTVATLTGSQTLTNKTLSTGSTWQGNAIAVTYGGTGLTGIAALSVPVANALNTYTYVTATAGQSIRINAGGTAWEAFTPSTNSGTVTTVSVTSANGFAGTVANATSTPAITLSTSVTGVLKGNGTAISAATAGTDYQAPLVSGTNIKTVNSTSLLGSGDVAVQETLVSGTNIKTVGGTSLLGSGDVPVGVSTGKAIAMAIVFGG